MSANKLNLINVSSLRNSLLELYSKLLESSNERTVFHYNWWHKAVVKGTNNSYGVIYYLILNKNDELLSAMPVFYHKKFFIIVVSAPPLTPYLGPLFKFQGNLKMSSKLTFMKRINKLYAKALRELGLVTFYPFSSEHIDLQPYLWTGFNVKVRYTYIVNLSKSTDEIWNNMDKRRKWEIRKTLKQGLRVTENSKINTFIKLFNRSMTRHSTRREYDKIWNEIFQECSSRNRCKILTTYSDNGEPLASIFIVWDDKRVYYIGSGMRENPYAATSLLMWKAIRLTKGLGLKEFDFEGSNIQSIEKYFRKFGGEIKALQYIEENSLRLKFWELLKRFR